MPTLYKQFVAGSLLFVVAIAMTTTTSCVNDPIFTDPMDTMPPDTIPADTSAICDPDTIYFRKDILPIIGSSCGMGFCHNEESRAGGIVITSFETLMASEIVVPGDPENSMMYQVMSATDLTEIMPPSPRGPISDTNILVVKRWIEQGAKNLDCPDDTTCVVPSTVSFQRDVFPVIDKHCIGCHSGNNPWAGLFLRNYDEIAASAATGDLVGVISHAEGFPPMPQDLAKLLQCDIDKIAQWVEDGTPNN